MKPVLITPVVLALAAAATGMVLSSWPGRGLQHGASAARLSSTAPPAAAADVPVTPAPASGPEGSGAKPSDTVQVGDLTAHVVWAEPQYVGGGIGRGRPEQVLLLVARVELSNTSRTKVVKFAGWHGQGRAEDEHGNVYPAYAFPSGWGFAYYPPPPKGAAEDPRCDRTGGIAAGPEAIQPGASVARYIFFERSAAVATEVTITLPSPLEGSRDAVRLRVPVSRPSS